MLRNYFKVAVRNLLRSKGFSLMNILGLAIGMASALIILLWVQNEWSFDRSYPNKARLYEVWNKDKWGNDTVCWHATPKVMGDFLKKDYPEIERSSRLNWTQTLLFSVGEKRLNVKGTMVDPDFLTMFSVPFIKGNAATALNTPNSITITKSLAEKLFGNEDPMGKTVKVDNKSMFNVTGVIENLPANSQFDYEYLIPWSYMHATGQDDPYWGNNSTRNLVLLKEGTNFAALNEKIKTMVVRHDPGDGERQFLYLFSKEHLYSSFKDGKQAGGLIDMVRAFLLLAVFILLIACINFMNLSTARSEKRAKEVGIRKTVGALKQSLIIQFLLESLLISAIAGVLALLIVQLCLPPFNTLTQKELIIAYGSPVFWVGFLGFITFTGLMAGSYPAFFLSAFQPVQVLKGTFRKVNALVTPRRVLVIIQFTIAIFLIIGTIIIEQQLKYAQNRESGYDRNNLLYVTMEGDIQKNADLIKNELLSQHVAVNVSNTSSPLTQSWSNTGSIQWEGKPADDKNVINRYASDGNLAKTAGMTIIQGRDIDLANFPSDSMAAVLNETAVKVMGFKNPIGQVISDDTSYHVVGVVKDFIIESPYEPVRAMVILGPHRHYNVMHVKLNSNRSTAENLATMEKIFKQYNPEYPFQYNFVDEVYAKKFKDEQITMTLAGLFACLTIFISCLGLFGLAAYTAEARVKEIGVRKVLGASIFSITTLLSKDFVTLVIISIILATPTAWYFMNKWLDNYPHYRISISGWTFVIAALVAIFISVLTVSYQAIKAALANPVKSLRSE